jgi:hypothetical protein
MRRQRFRDIQFGRCGAVSSCGCRVSGGVVLRVRTQVCLNSHQMHRRHLPNTKGDLKWIFSKVWFSAQQSRAPSHFRHMHALKKWSQPTTALATFVGHPIVVVSSSGSFPLARWSTGVAVVRPMVKELPGIGFRSNRKRSPGRTKDGCRRAFSNRLGEARERTGELNPTEEFNTTRICGHSSEFDFRCAEMDHGGVAVDGLVAPSPKVGRNGFPFGTRFSMYVLTSTHGVPSSSIQ